MTRQKKEHWLRDKLKTFQASATVEEKAKLVDMVNEHGINSDESSDSYSSLSEEDNHFRMGPATSAGRSTNNFNDDLSYSNGWELEFQGVDHDEILDEDDEFARLSDDEKLLEVEFEGETFKVGDCFRVKRFNDAILGIKYFVDEETVLCVPVLPFEKSIVGVFQKELAESKSPPNGFNYLQVPCRCQQGPCVCKKASEIHLSNLLERKTNGKLELSLPSKAYAPKDGRKFAYWDAAPKLISKKREGPLNCIDLFCGAGGASGGLKRAGYSVVMGVDDDFEALCAFYMNHGGQNPALHRFCLESVGKTEDDDHFYQDLFFKFLADMNFLASYIRQGGTSIFWGTVDEFLSAWENKEGFKEAVQANGKIHHVHISPPCQGFSAVKREPHPDDDEKNSLSFSIVKVGMIVRPLTMSFENVLGMWRRQFFERFLSLIYVGLMEAGYQFRQFDQLASKVGDPQVRSRLFMVAALDYVELPQVPAETHCHPDPDGSPNQLGKHTFRTAKDAIGCFENQFPENGKPLVGDDQYDLMAAKPSPALRASKAPKHYSENRTIQWQESHALSFPPSMHLHGSDVERQRQAGNALPIQQATALFRAIAEVLQWTYVGETSHSDAVPETD